MHKVGTLVDRGRGTPGRRGGSHPRRSAHPRGDRRPPAALLPGAARDRRAEVGTVSSERLAELAGVNAAKVRKDLSYLGSYGTRGVGYDVEYLLHEISRELGLTHDWPVAIVGIGNLGQALANYRGFGARGFRVVALVDADPAKVGKRVGDLDDRGARRPADRRRASAASRSASSPRRRPPPRRSPTGSSRPASRRSSTSRRRSSPPRRGRVDAQGRPRDRAADPVLLPTAPAGRGGPRRERRPGSPSDERAPRRDRRVPGEPAGRRAPLRRRRRRADRRPQDRGAARRRRRGRTWSPPSSATRSAPGPTPAGSRVAERAFSRTDLDGAWLATTATDDPAVDRRGVRGRRGAAGLGEHRRRPGELLVHADVGGPRRAISSSPSAPAGAAPRWRRACRSASRPSSAPSTTTLLDLLSEAREALRARGVRARTPIGGAPSIPACST